MFFHPLRAMIAGLMLVGLPAAAHEFWIDPVDFTVPVGTDLIADIRVGQAYSGAVYSYFAPKFRRFDVVQDGVVSPVAGRAGDRPALMLGGAKEGLAVVVHATQNVNLTYTEWDKFVSFVEHKDFGWAAGRHRERGLPETKFKETYARYAKSLIAVGDGQGQDSETGMITEIVALANPYTDDVSAGFPVKVLYDGKPRNDTQVELFAKAPDGTVVTTLHRTDGDGVALIPVQSGYMYLVDAVVMREVEALSEFDPVWESLWASLTFQMP